MEILTTKRTVVKVSDGVVSKNPAEVLITYSLSSCMGVCLYDPVTHIGGMLHYQLPTSDMDRSKAEEWPFMFADTGMNVLLERMTELGAEKRRMQVKLAGGAATEMGPENFDIGKRNYVAIKKILWENGMFIGAEDTGGSKPRNMSMNIADGVVEVKCNGLEKRL